MRLEGDDDRGQAQFRATFRQLPQYRLMSQMHAVEIADGRHTTAVAAPQIVQTVDQLHDNVILSKTGSSSITVESSIANNP